MHVQSLPLAVVVRSLEPFLSFAFHLHYRGTQPPPPPPPLICDTLDDNSPWQTAVSTNQPISLSLSISLCFFLNEASPSCRCFRRGPPSLPFCLYELSLHRSVVGASSLKTPSPAPRPPENKMKTVRVVSGLEFILHVRPDGGVVARPLLGERVLCARPRVPAQSVLPTQRLCRWCWCFSGGGSCCARRGSSGERCHFRKQQQGLFSGGTTSVYASKKQREGYDDG